MRDFRFMEALHQAVRANNLYAVLDWRAGMITQISA